MQSVVVKPPANYFRHTCTPVILFWAFWANILAYNMSVRTLTEALAGSQCPLRVRDVPYERQKSVDRDSYACKACSANVVITLDIHCIKPIGMLSFVSVIFFLLYIFW